MAIGTQILDRISDNSSFVNTLGKVLDVLLAKQRREIFKSYSLRYFNFNTQWITVLDERHQEALLQYL